MFTVGVPIHIHKVAIHVHSEINLSFKPEQNIKIYTLTSSLMLMQYSEKIRMRGTLNVISANDIYDLTGPGCI